MPCLPTYDVRMVMSMSGWMHKSPQPISQLLLNACCLIYKSRGLEDCYHPLLAWRLLSVFLPIEITSLVIHVDKNLISEVLLTSLGVF